MTRMPTEISARREGERGAALITALLVAMLLLAAGGALIASAGMSASNAVDVTAEAQAYYAADAGLQAALSVFRRNKPSSPAGTPATFRGLVCGTSNPCTNGGSTLGLWLNYTGGEVVLSDNPATRMAFALTVTDPSKNATDTLATTYQPRYLLVRSVGRGPKGATKVLEMMVDRFKFEYDAPAPLVLRESTNGVSHVVMAPGAGTPNVYSGTDVANPSVTKPAVGVGNTLFALTRDFDIATAAMATETMTGGVSAVGGSSSIPWPSIVADSATAASTVTDLRGFATSTACPANTQPLSGFIFIEGDCTLGPNNSTPAGKAGLLVITGTLTTSGNFNFKGLVFVLGEGQVDRSGGGGGTIEGGILAAKFAASGVGGFGGVLFDTGGGGNSRIVYNSKAIEDALAEVGPRPVGVVEK